MNLFKKEQEDVKVIRPPNSGWLEKKLSKKEMDYLWRCIENKRGSNKERLAGNIHASNILNDRSDWFFINTLRPLIKNYEEEFPYTGCDIPTSLRHPYHLQTWWVNYQKQHEFNPEHDHAGVYSFVVWMKIPTKYDEQIKNPLASNSTIKAISTFQFQYATIFGKIASYVYPMNPENEGTLVFFPAALRHQVYPFFNCEEDRISISGNIFLNTAKTL